MSHSGHLPANPFVGNLSLPSSSVVFQHVLNPFTISSSEVSAAGGPCAYIDANIDPSISTQSHWIFVSDTLEVFAATNTPGINECAM